MKWSKRWVKQIAAVVLLLALTIGSFSLFGQVARADDAQELSFPARVTDLVNEMNKIMSPKGDGYLKQSRNLTGNVGVLLGYSNENKDQEGIIGWITSALSNSSATTSYSQINAFPADKEGAKTGGSLICYAGYGWALQALGVDSTATTGTPFGRWIFGALLGFAYVISMVVPILFQAAIKIMKVLNPFRLFSGISTVWGITFEEAPGPLADLAGSIGRLYNIAYDLGMVVVVPVMTASLIIGILIMKSTNSASRSQSSVGGKILKWCIRLLFIVAGVPAIGAMYTQCLNLLGDSLGSANTAGVEIVCSTLVDFESWARETRLDPSSINIKVKYNENGTFSIASGTMRGRTLALQVNRKNPYLNGVIPSGDGTSDYGYLDSSNISDQGGGVFSDAVWDLIGRYMKGAFYTSASYENEQKGQFSQDYAKNEDYKEIVDTWFDPDKASLEETPNMLKTDGDANLEGINGITVFNNGALGVTTSGSTRTYKGSGGVGGKYTTRMGLSSMSMYNYLNTKFEDSSLTVYSTKKSSSGMVRESHRSVNVIGGGMQSMFIYAQALIQLFTISILGIFYGFSVMFSNIKRGYLIIFDTPLALMGSIQAIGKILTYTCVLIIEIVGTIFIYDVLNEVLIGMMDIVAGIWDDVGIVSTFANVSGVATVVKCSLTIIFCLVFLVMAMRMRKKFVRGVDEAVGNVICKFVNQTQAMGSSSGGPTQAQQDRANAAIMAVAGSSPAAQPKGPSRVGQAAKSLMGSAGHMMMMQDMLDKRNGGKDGKGAYDGNGTGSSDSKARSKAEDIAKNGGILGHGNEPVDGNDVKNVKSGGSPDPNRKASAGGNSGNGMDPSNPADTKNVSGDDSIIDSTARGVSGDGKTDGKSGRDAGVKDAAKDGAAKSAKGTGSKAATKTVQAAAGAAKAKAKGGSAVAGAVKGAVSDGSSGKSGSKGSKPGVKGVAADVSGKVLTKDAGKNSSMSGVIGHERPSEKQSPRSDKSGLKPAKPDTSKGVSRTAKGSMSKAQARLTKGMDPNAAKRVAKGVALGAAGVYSGNAYLLKKGISEFGGGVVEHAEAKDAESGRYLKGVAGQSYDSADAATAAARKAASQVADTARSVSRMQSVAGQANRVMGSLSGDREQAEAGRRMANAARQNRQTANTLDMRGADMDRMKPGTYRYKKDK